MSPYGDVTAGLALKLSPPSHGQPNKLVQEAAKRRENFVQCRVSHLQMLSEAVIGTSERSIDCTLYGQRRLPVFRSDLKPEESTFGCVGDTKGFQPVPQLGATVGG